jgi:hypothetical protein
MSNPPLEPIDPELAALVDAERRAEPPVASLERVWSRLALGAPPGGGRGHAGGGAGRGWLAAHAAPVAAGAFVAGAVAGAAGYAALQAPPPARIVYVDRAAPPVQVAASVGPTDLPPVAAPLPSAAPTDRPATRASSAGGASSSISAERVLLDDARAAVASGDAARALSLVDEHARRFPRAQLWEEREALAIQALVHARRYDEARARGARFRASAPNSLFLPAIDASLASIP